MRSETPRVSLYVDRNQPNFWIVRDQAGEFWLVPSGESGWERRQPYNLSEDAQLEALPAHYHYVISMAG